MSAYDVDEPISSVLPYIVERNEIDDETMLAWLSNIAQGNNGERTLRVAMVTCPVPAWLIDLILLTDDAGQLRVANAVHDVAHHCPVGISRADADRLLVAVGDDIVFGDLVVKILSDLKAGARMDAAKLLTESLLLSADLLERRL